MNWKSNWDDAKENLIKWWRGEGLAVCLCANKQTPRKRMPKPDETVDWPYWWTDPCYRLARAEYEMVNTDYLAEAFPYFDTQIGPGSLGTFIGSEPEFASDTVWYKTCFDNPDTRDRIIFNPENNHWWQVHLALIDIGLQHCQDNYLVGIPDLIENIDTLAQLRGPQPLLYDLVERPGWVKDRLMEINDVYFKAFNLLFDRVKDETGGNAFSAFHIWGPGKTAKIQCDFSAMISPTMYAEFVLPYMQEQCNWLDYSLYHLDGTTAIQQLDNILSIKSLNAIEWTPQAGKPGGGADEWYGLYRRIIAGGKSVQAVGVAPDEVIPLLDDVGPQGMMILLDRNLDIPEAEKLYRSLEPYY